MGLISPSFFGYFTAYRSMMANQMGLNTVNHNISNVNTPGYSRQSIQQSAGSAYAPTNSQSLFNFGQMGTGVTVTNVTRSHDVFVDGQIRNQKTMQGFQTALQDNLRQIEDIMGEPSDRALSTTMNDFFSAAQALSVHPDDKATRIGFIQSAQTLLTTFKQQAQQLKDLRTNVIGDPNVTGTTENSLVAITAGDINDRLAEVANLNQQIMSVTVSGAMPNDLLDRRDVLLEELSERMNLSVEYRDNEQVDVKLGDTYLVQGKFVRNELTVAPNDDDNPVTISLSQDGTDVTSDITGGTLGGLLQIGGTADGKSTIRNMLATLDTLFGEIASGINGLQATGRDYNGDVPSSPNDEIFVQNGGSDLIGILNYDVNPEILDDPNLIAAASDSTGTFQGVGDGRNALAMVQLATTAMSNLGNSTFSEFYNGAISSLGTQAKAAQDTSANLGNVIQQLEQRRQSVQGVSMEEELINLLRYQRGFESSAKVMSTMDKMYEIIINKMF